MSSARACAKINLGLVVGPVRPDGKHEVVTVLVGVDLHDTVEVEAVSATGIVVKGFEDTIVRRALSAFADHSGSTSGWRVNIEKRIPVAAGLGGGSSDAAAALRLANELEAVPLSRDELHAIAAQIGSDVPFFLEGDPSLASGNGTELKPVVLPLDVWVVLVLPSRDAKESTAGVYEAFDARGGAAGFDERRAALLDALARARSVADLGALPSNDLASSPLADELVRLGALRADVTGAGPAVYGLFEDERDAEEAERAFRMHGKTWMIRPTTGA
jgi:4-diphosphocytidyl-2-C-methyl-D-erythritol kinase